MSSIKRFCALTAAIFVMVCSLWSYMTIAVCASDEITGYWKLAETRVDCSEDSKGDIYTESYSATMTKHIHKHTGKYVENGKTYIDKVVFEATCTDLPDSAKPGDELDVDLSIRIVSSNVSHFYFGMSAGMNRVEQTYFNNDYHAFTSENGYSYGGGQNALAVGTNGVWGIQQDGSAKTDVAHYTFPTKGGDEKLELIFNTSWCISHWIYEWIDTTQKNDTDEEEIKDEEDEWEEVIDPYKDQEEKTDASNKRGEQKTGIKNEVMEKKDITEGGKYIAVALGLVTVATAGGGTVLARRYKRKKNPDYKEKKEKDNKPKSSYSMVMYKEFGNTINAANDEGYHVYTRIDETTVNPSTGLRESRSRDDYTAKIQVSGIESIDVVSTQMAAKGGHNYKAALIKADVSEGDTFPKNGIVEFTYKGEGGFFKNDVTFKIEGPEDQTVTTPATPEEGEDPSEIRKIIVEGVTESSAKPASKMSLDEIYDEDTKDYSSYRMVVYKRFGNGIKKGAEEEVWIFARIEEYRPISDRYVFRDDLTQRITCFSGDNCLNVTDYGTSMSGCLWKTCYVTAPGDITETTGMVSFRFIGKGGTYTRHVEFMLVGEPVMKFIMPDDSGQGNIISEDGWFDVIAGDRREYEVRFMLEECTAAPADFDYNRDENTDFDIRVVPVENNPFYYIAKINNNTSEVPFESVYSKPATSRLVLTAIFEDKSTCSGDLTAMIYRDGISVNVTQVDVVDDRAVVDCFTYAGFYGDDEEAKQYFVYPFFEITLAVWAENRVKLVTPVYDDLNIKDLESENQRCENIVKIFDYSFEYETKSANFWFQQETELFEAKEPYLVKLPISIEHDNIEYFADLPIRLRGAGYPEPDRREIELHYVLWCIRRFTENNEDQLKWFNYVKELYADARVSALSLRMTGKEIYRLWMKNERERGEKQLNLANRYDWGVYISDWVKWLAARSFTLTLAIITRKAVMAHFAWMGPKAQKEAGDFFADLVDALVQPAAEFVLDCVEEMMDSYINDRTFDIERTGIWNKMSNAADGTTWVVISKKIGDNVLDEAVTLDFKSKARKLIGYLGIYFGISIVRNLMKKYAEEGELDFPGVIFDTFKDLSNNLIKSMLGDLFKELLINPDENGRATAALGRWVGDKVGRVIRQEWETMSKFTDADAAVKWLNEMLGEGVGKLYGYLDQFYANRNDNYYVDTKSYTGETGLYLFIDLPTDNPDRPFHVQINLGRGLFYVSTGLLAPLTIVMDLMFGKNFGIPEPIQYPKDPEMPSEEEVKKYKIGEKGLDYYLN